MSTCRRLRRPHLLLNNTFPFNARNFVYVYILHIEIAVHEILFKYTGLYISLAPKDKLEVIFVVNAYPRYQTVSYELKSESGM